jgi:ABC-type branched-subunit amino acid transport system substrate-binding protein
MRSKWLQLLALTFAFALIAAACGDSDDDAASQGDETTTTAEEGGETTETSEEGAGTTEASDTSDGGTETSAATGAEPASIEEWEALWQTERQAVVDKIVDGGYGYDESTGILTGPGGFEADLNTCPTDWSPTEGVTDTSVKIGYSNAQSGTLAAYGDIGVAWQVYIDYVNANGGIDGKQVELLTRDDGYVASVTIENVDQMLQSDKPFKITTLGSPNTLAVRETLNSNCVPHAWSQTGLPAWADPEHYPWTTGLAMSYYTEAGLWVKWIEENMADQAPVKVAALVADNDFGIAYEGGFERFSEGSEVIGDFVVQQHDPAAPTVTNEVTSLAGEDPDVFILMTAGAPCTQGLQDAATSGLLEAIDAGFVPQTCKAISSFLTPAGDAADGYYVIGGGSKELTDPAHADDSFIQFVKGLVSDAGLDPNNSQFTNAFLFGWAEIESLRIASMLPGGLTRPNYILAVRSIDMTHPMLLSGIRFSMNGVEDAAPIEGSEVVVFDSATQSYELVGAPVDNNGTGGVCSWIDGEGCAA